MDLELIAPDHVFATADAARLGLDRNALSRLVRAGRCVRLTTGWYAVVGAQAPGPGELHRLRSVALGRQFRSRAAVSHHSRLLLAGLPTYSVRLDTVHLTSLVPSSGGVSVSRPGVVVHRQVAGLRLPDPACDPVSDRAGDPLARHRPRCVPIAHAVVQTGLLAGPESFLVSADAAVGAGLTSVGTLAGVVERFATHTGIAGVRAALPLVDGRHESPGESRTAWVLGALGFDIEAQVEVVAEGRVFRADFRIGGTRVLVEFDGAVKYDGRQALFEEKRREDALRRSGWVVVRLVWADLADPALVARRILDALALAA